MEASVKKQAGPPLAGIPAGVDGPRPLLTGLHAKCRANIYLSLDSDTTVTAGSVFSLWTCGYVLVRGGGHLLWRGLKGPCASTAHTCDLGFISVTHSLQTVPPELATQSSQATRR